MDVAATGPAAAWESTPGRSAGWRCCCLCRLLPPPAAAAAAAGRARTLGRVGWAQHAPLAGLQRARARDLASLLKLARDAGHHAQGGDEGQPRQHLLVGVCVGGGWAAGWAGVCEGRERGSREPESMIQRASARKRESASNIQRSRDQGPEESQIKRAREPERETPAPSRSMQQPAAPPAPACTHLRDPLALHAEALDGPVARRDGVLHPKGQCVRADALGDVKLPRAVGLGQHRVRLAPQVAVQPAG